MEASSRVTSLRRSVTVTRRGADDADGPDGADGPGGAGGPGGVTGVGVEVEASNGLTTFHES